MSAKIAPVEGNPLNPNPLNPETQTPTSPRSPPKISRSTRPSRWQMLNFQEFMIFFFGIGPAALGRPASKLIHPNSQFARGTAIFTVLLLLYTALVVPVTVGFFWDQDSCDKLATLEIDTLVDTWFIIQIFVSFFTGQFHKGVYTDDFGRVTTFYLKNGFVFDLFTSVPVSYLDWWILNSQCGEAAEDDDAVDLAPLRIIRALKPFRLLKMLRILKVFKVLQIFDLIEEALRPPPLLFRVFKVLIGIGFLGHFCTCTFWLIKTLSQTEEAIQNFTFGMNIGRDPGLIRKYILASYFINTAFTTVGFGDIAADTTAEQVFCVIVMYLGTMVFGILLSEIESAVSSMRAFVRSKGRVKQDLMDFLGENDVSTGVSKKILQWVDFDLECKQKDYQRAQAIEHIPPQLRRMLVEQLHHDDLYKVSLFAHMRSSSCESLVTELWDKMETQSFFESLPIALHTEKADRLFFILKGNVSVYLKDANKLVNVLGPGDFFGEHSLTGDTRWGAELDTLCNYICKTNVLCKVLTKAMFDDILMGYDEEIRTEVEEISELHQERVARTPNAEDGNYLGSDTQGSFVISVLALARWSSMVSKAVRLSRIANIGSASLMHRLSQKIIINATSGVNGNTSGNSRTSPRRLGSNMARRTSSTSQEGTLHRSGSDSHGARRSIVSASSEEIGSEESQRSPIPTNVIGFSGKSGGSWKDARLGSGASGQSGPSGSGRGSGIVKSLRPVPSGLESVQSIAAQPLQALPGQPLSPADTPPPTQPSATQPSAPLSSPAALPQLISPKSRNSPPTPQNLMVSKVNGEVNSSSTPQPLSSGPSAPSAPSAPQPLLAMPSPHTMGTPAVSSPVGASTNLSAEITQVRQGLAKHSDLIQAQAEALDGLQGDVELLNTNLLALVALLTPKNAEVV